MDIKFEDMQKEITKDNRKVLFIVGNGFDLAHGIPSKYEDFRKWLFAGTNEEKILEENIRIVWNAYFFLKDKKEESSVKEKDCWNELEKMMSEFNCSLVEQIAIILKNIDDYIGEEEVRRAILECASEPVRDIYDLLPLKLREWIKAVDDQVVAKGREKISVFKKLFDSVKNKKFLTFNYTSTLEKWYGIDMNEILHIHGDCDHLEKVIFGPLPAIEDFFGSAYYSMKNEISDRKNLMDIFLFQYFDTKGIHSKYSGDIILLNKSKFLKYEDVTKIVVLGHSLNEVDKSYFEEIRKGIGERIVTWYLSHYGDENKNQREEFIKGLCVNSPDIIKHFDMPQIEDELDLRVVAEYEADKAAGKVQIRPIEELWAELGLEKKDSKD